MDRWQLPLYRSFKDRGRVVQQRLYHLSKLVQDLFVIAKSLSVTLRKPWSATTHYQCSHIFTLENCAIDAFVAAASSQNSKLCPSYGPPCSPGVKEDGLRGRYLKP